MTRSDWNQYENAASNHELSTEQTHEGSSSLKTNDASKYSQEILAVSEDDSPEESQIVTEVYPDGETAFYTIHRYQDTANYYMLGFYYGGRDAAVGLRKVVGGKESVVQEYSLSGGNVGGQKLSDGSYARDRFAPYRATLWVDSGGDLRGRIEEDADRDGYWTQLGDDMVDTTPDFTDGGGVGLGSYNAHTYEGNVCYWDETKVYY